MAKRSRISQNMVFQIVKRDGLECTYCGDDNVNRLTIDHVFPKSQGGKDVLSNLTISCKKCNEAKRDLLLVQFLRAFEIKVTRKIARFL